MTVSSTTRKAGPFLGNGVTTAFPFTFKVFTTSDIQLTKTDADGVGTVLTLDSDYSVSLNADQDNNPGGTITYPLAGEPLATGETLVGLGSLVAKQQTDITNLGRFLPQVHENVFDYLCILIQQLEEKAGRALLLPPQDDTTAEPLPTLANRLDKLLGFNSATGQPEVSTFTLTQLASVVAAIYTAAAGPLDALSFLQGGAGALSMSGQEKARQWVMVTDYAANGVSGARVDPTGTVDSILGIQAAVDHVASLGGGDVLFPYTDAFYSITSAIRLKDNVTLRGMGGRPKIKNTGTSAATRDAGAVVINDGYYTVAGNSNIHICNLTLQNRYQDFLTPVADSGATIGLRYGVFFAGVTRASIVDCHILDTCAEGIYMGGIDASRDLCSDILVHGNSVENCFASGIAVTHGQRIRISDNLVTNTTIFGVDVEPNTGMVGKDITISGNVIDGVRADYYKNSTGYGKSNALGISLTTGSLPNQVYNVSVTGNTVRDVQRWTTSAISDFGMIQAVGVLSCSIVGNTCTDSESSGIIVRGGSRSITVTGNTVENVYNFGIGVNGSTDITITGNTVEDCSARGIQATNSAARVSITGNTVRDSVTAGIYVQAVSDIAISGNTVADTRSGVDRLMTYGVHISSSCDSIQAIGNVITNTVSDATRNADAATNTVTFNVEDTVWRLLGTNFVLQSDGGIYKAGHMTLTARGTSGLANNSLFLDSSDNVLKFKDSTGTLRSLW